nr:serine hydrolase [Lachnospiraceae bacterium]
TKILTTLIAAERCELSETVKFSREAVNSIERASSNMGIDIGQELTVEQCLYGILVYSANEVANAIGEHVSGSIDAFVELMNQRAAELGCQDSHFVTTNGLHDDNHYTTPYDLAQIGRAFFANETLAKISGTNYYHIPPSRKQPDDIELYTHNQLTRGKYSYDGYVGGKTGYTTVAHQTLVTCAERGGLRLICVVMREDSPNQYLDTMTLFDYGFENFKKVNVAENETRYTIRDSAFFENDALGTNQSLVAIDPEDTIVMPNTLSFDEVDAFMSDAADPSDPERIATIEYSYENKPLGSAAVVLSNTTKGFDFYDPTGNHVGHKETLYYVNIKKWIRNFVLVFALLLVLTFLLGGLRSYLSSRHVNRQNVNFRKKEKPLKRNGSWQRRQMKVHNRISKDRAREKQLNTTYYNHRNQKSRWKRN